MGPGDIQKIIVGVDYGTTATGIRYILIRHDDQGGTTIDGPKTLYWPFGMTLPKTPSRIAYYEENPQFPQARPYWGFQIEAGATASSWTKLLLDRSVTSNLTEFQNNALNTAARHGIFRLPEGKAAVVVVKDFLHQVYQYTVRRLQDISKHQLGNIPVEYWFTVPESWSRVARELTINAATQAGFGQRPSDSLLLATEPRAAAITVFGENPTWFQDGDTVLIVDCGGGTIDLASYYVPAICPYIRLLPISSGRGGKSGGTAIDGRFYELMEERFGVEFVSLSYTAKAPGSMLMREFEKAKRKFFGSTTESFRLPLTMTVNAETGTSDPSFYRANRYPVVLSAADMRGLFDPVVDQIIGLIRTELRTTYEQSYYSVNKIVLVGGLSSSPYLSTRLITTFNAPNLQIAVSPEPVTAVANGASLLGLVCNTPRHYGFGCIDGTVCWVVNKDGLYPPDYRDTKELLLPRLEHDEWQQKHIPIYACDLREPPKRVNADSVVGRIPIDMTRLNLAQFPYAINYCIVTTFSGRSTLNFTVLVLGVVVGSYNIQIL